MKKNKRIDLIINENKDSMLSILQEVQKTDGYLSAFNLEYIAKKMDMSVEEVYSIANFYNQFKFKPVGKYVISICLGTACYVKGANDIVDEITEILRIKNGECTSDNLFSLDTTRCLGCCSLAPVLKINDDIYSYVKRNQIKDILSKYK